MEMQAHHIAPCGMNCSLCAAYIRDKKPCPGCRAESPGKPKHCVTCAIKNCPLPAKAGLDSCIVCETPCRRLKNMDASYESKYHINLRGNLEFIQQYGMQEFLLQEQEHWTCRNCGATLSAHSNLCPSCKHSRIYGG